MGVPSFYRWLVGKYPKIVANAVEEVGDNVDSSKPNPNGMEFDNLYLDMNGIIHPCFHPEDQLFPPTTFDEVFRAIFDYIDRIFRIVRPRRLLYMAIDGVAPRAKMNQQRSRRFRTAKDAEIAEAEEDRLIKEFEREGKKVLPRQEYQVSDSNVITPGTEFMEQLAKALEYYIRLRLNADPGWEHIKVILSDANVPGEGEHKIMSFIRLQRNLYGYDPNTHHCLYGLDADLIMLSLATHELHFSIFREDMLNKEVQENLLSSIEVTLSRKEFNVAQSRQRFGRLSEAKGMCTKNKYQFLHIWILREYLVLDMKPDPHVDVDVERIVDDFIFICFLTGNDFLPHIPSVEIHEGAIDLLISVYKKMFKKMGYLVDIKNVKDIKSSYINAKSVEKFILEVGSYEERIFSKRYNMQQSKIRKLMMKRLEEEENVEDYLENPYADAGNEFCDLNPQTSVGHDKFGMQKDACSSRISADFSRQCFVSKQIVLEDSLDDSDIIMNTKELRQKLKALLRNKADHFNNGIFENDKVKLGVQGWKSRYYKEKFSVEGPAEIEKKRKEIVENYMEGVCWVLHYYFAGVCSWGWHYGFHYGPFASDFKGLSCNFAFAIGKPFKPFDQLMAVLPPRSSIALPNLYRHLMTSDSSPIKSFYVNDFLVDMNGKRFTWQGVVKLDFINEGLLLEATKSIEKELQNDEKERNTFKYEKIITRDSDIIGSKITSLCATEELGKRCLLDGKSCQINGYISFPDNHIGHNYFRSPLEGMNDITDDHAVSAVFNNPDYHSHIPKVLENVITPEETITEADIVEKRLWHEHSNTSWQRSTPRNYVDVPDPAFASTRVAHQGCGSGRSGMGRGRNYVDVPDPAFASTRVAHQGCGSGRSGMGRGNLVQTSYSSHDREARGIDARNTGWRRGGHRNAGQSSDLNYRNNSSHGNAGSQRGSYNSYGRLEERRYGLDQQASWARSNGRGRARSVPIASNTGRGYNVGCPAAINSRGGFSQHSGMLSSNEDPKIRSMNWQVCTASTSSNSSGGNGGGSSLPSNTSR